VAYDGDEILFRGNLEPSHGITGMVVVVGEPLDNALEIFVWRVSFSFERSI
jgi:hypothetical protein